MYDKNLDESFLYKKYCKWYIKNDWDLEKYTTSLPCRIFKKIKIFLCYLSQKLK